MAEEGDGFFIPFPFLGGVSEEMMQRMRDAEDHKEMVADDYRHSTARLFDGQTEEQLVTMKNIFHVLAMNAEPSSRVLVAYYEGVITGILHARHNVCLGCDHNHDKLMEEQMQHQESQDETLVASDGGDPFLPAPLKPDLKIGESGMLSDVQLENMFKYNLDDLRSINENLLLGFVCMNCGTQYPTIEDRMLKAPDDCSGCHQKEMWG